MEIEALRTVVRGTDEPYHSMARGLNATEAAACINAIATSTYRIKRYDLALPLLKIAKAMLDEPGSKVKGLAAGFVANNYGSSRYSYVLDSLSEGVAYIHADDIALTSHGEEDRDAALLEAMRAYEEQINNAHARSEGPKWDAVANYAECCLLKGWLADALSTCDGLEAEIAHQGQGSSDYMARCLLVRARVKYAIAQERLVVTGGISAVNERITDMPQGARKKHRASAGAVERMFREARKDAVDSLALKADLKGVLHVDVRKANELIGQIDASVDKSNDISIEQKNAIKNTEQDKLESKLRKVSRSLRPVELVMRISRGDKVDLWDMFGLEEDVFNERFDGAL